MYSKDKVLSSSLTFESLEILVRKFKNKFCGTIDRMFNVKISICNTDTSQ